MFLKISIVETVGPCMPDDHTFLVTNVINHNNRQNLDYNFF